MKENSELCRGSAKTVYQTEKPNELILEFRDDISAFNGEKLGQPANKGLLNNYINAYLMQHIAQGGVATHFIQLLSERRSLVQRLDMIPLECVVRNKAAGSLCRRLGITEGEKLNRPTFEYFLKNGALQDPFINEHHIRTFAWASDADMRKMQELAFATNKILIPIFASADLELIDFKLEFGRATDAQLVLGDEVTPDNCRIWDAKTKVKLDKDRFRHNLGDVVDGYQEIAKRLQIDIPKSGVN